MEESAHLVREREALAQVTASLTGSPGRVGLSRVERVTTAWHRSRPRCSLVRLDLAGDGRTVPVVVKLRHATHEPRDGDAHGRPRPADASDLGPAEASRLEHRGLTGLASAVATDGDVSVRALQPVLLLEQQGALVLEHVTAVTLRERLSARSGRRGLAAARVSASGPGPFRAVGRLLALHHAQVPAGGRERLADAATAGGLGSRLTGYLGACGEQPGLLHAVDGALDRLVGRTGPLALGTGHGDAAPRNVFAPAGGPTVLFDPMPLWRVPVVDDLASFLVAVRLSGPQLAAHGRLHAPADLDAVEQDLLAGYGDVDPDALRLFVLLAVLDRWAWLASPPAPGAPRTGTARLRRRWLAAAVRAEVRRLLRTA